MERMILKTDSKKTVVLKSFETEQECIVALTKSLINHHKIIFSGVKKYLKKRPEAFWKPLVEGWYPNYGKEFYQFATAFASGQSAIEGEGEFILITEENI